MFSEVFESFFSMTVHTWNQEKTDKNKQIFNSSIISVDSLFTLLLATSTARPWRESLKYVLVLIKQKIHILSIYSRWTSSPKVFSCFRMLVFEKVCSGFKTKHWWKKLEKTFFSIKNVCFWKFFHVLFYVWTGLKGHSKTTWFLNLDF